MKRQILKKQSDGTIQEIELCLNDMDFLTQTAKILQESGASASEIVKVKTAYQCTEALEELGYMVKPENIVKAIDNYTTKVAGAIMDLAESSNFSLSKIKIDRSAETGEIYYYQGMQKCSKEVKFVGYEQVLPEFLTLFRAMTKHLVTVLDFPEEWADKITTTGLSITYKDDEAMGMVITAQKAIEGLNAPLNLHTPFIKFSSYGSAHDCCDDVMFMPDCEKELEELFHHSRLYMKGETRQKQLSLLDEIEASALEG